MPCNTYTHKTTIDCFPLKGFIWRGSVVFMKLFEDSFMANEWKSVWSPEEFSSK